MNIINPFLIKESFSKYTDSSSFDNYQKIAKEYYKLFEKLKKRISNIQDNQLRSKVKNWFFNLPLESRIKICTVENELFSDFIYQMYLRTEHDKSLEFFPKADLYEVYDLTKTQNIYKDFMGEAPLIEFSLDNYFNSRSDIYSSYAEKFNMMEKGLYMEDEHNKKYDSNIFEFINNDIKFYSVHHKPYPDCFCFSPYFLLNEERFDSTFNFFGNINYFKKLIKPFYDLDKNIYGYHLPDWFNDLNNNSNYSVTKYIFSFIEQAILVKYFLNNYLLNKKQGNKNTKNDLIFSLINDDILNSIFTDRKTVINYFNMNYNDINSKKKLLDETNIANIFDNILKDNEINGKIVVYNHIRRNDNYNSSKGAMLIEPLLNVNNNYYIYNPIYDDIGLFLKTNQNERNNYVINTVKKNINKVIDLSDNITFTDFLLYQNAHNLWEYEYFINYKIIEYFINLFNEKNYNDLLKEEKETNTKKKKKRKKKKNQKNGNNNEININENKESNINNNLNNKENNENKNKINLMNIELESYKELFKDEEKILYAPYYLSVNYDLKKKFKNIKENKIKSITKKKKKQDIIEIYNYIKNDFLLKYIINKVIHLQPDNFVNFFDNKNDINNKLEQNKPEGNKYTKIKGLKLIKKNKKKEEDNNDDIITINFNLNDKNNNKNNKDEINLTKDKKEIKDNNIMNIDDNFNEKNNKTSTKDNLNKNEIKIIEEKNINIKLKKEDSNQLNQMKLQNNENKNIRSNSNQSRNKSTQKKKQKKENIFFLFDTIKTKQKNKNKSKSPIKPNNSNNIQNTLNMKILKINNIGNNDLSFLEKLHNNILKNEKKVNIILQYLSVYKNYCINEITKIINKTYETNLINFFIDLYGSYTTGLMIEASDIDINIKLYNITKEEFNKYFTDLYQNLNSENKFEKIIPISTASVPVIKLIIDTEKFIQNDKELEKEFIKLKQQNFYKNYIFDKNELNQIRVDITFILDFKAEYLGKNNNEIMNKIGNDQITLINKNNNEKSNVIYIKEQLEIFPEIKPILILLKRYFYVKNMNFSFEGGLSSYNLFLLILSFAKYNNFSQNKKINLGYFLIQFLEFFGKIFDFKNFCVNVNSPYIYEVNSFNNYNSGKSLVILDPLTGLNASKSSYKIIEIQNMFLNAYNFFEKEKLNYEKEIYNNENKDKRNNDKSQKFEGILGLTKIHKNEYSKKNNKNKNVINIIDKFFCS